MGTQSNVSAQPQIQTDTIAPMEDAKPATIGSIIDRMFVVREERKLLADTDKDLKAEFDELEVQLINAMDTQDAMQSRGRSASATITEDLYPTEIDWDVLTDYIKETDSFHLLQRRLNTAPWREMLTINGEPLPGTKSYLRRSISLRKV
jgi:hypothetical protein